ncbi:MAG: hypothetical protein R3C59_05275 [Planctomycetaceae bacterium]
MFRKLFGAFITAAVLAAAPMASAQFYDSGCSSCSGSAPAYAPAAYSSMANCAPVASCTPIQPVYSACYQTVPVTTYQQEKQTVEVPYYKTEYENRNVTVYEPVTRQREIEVPTVSYQTIQENRVVHRDMGRWKTDYIPVPKCAPCQVDPRPGVIGWMNRTGYSFRNAFTPNYRTTRSYVPQMMACNVPTTRQVAIAGTRKVVVNETQMVARQTTEKVAVQKLAFRKEEVTVSRPVTAYRTVPIGSALAFGGYGYGGSSMAFWGDSTTTQTARLPEPDPAFNAPRSAFDEDQPTRSSDRANSNSDPPIRKSSHSHPLQPVNPPAASPQTFESGQQPFSGFDDTRRRVPSNGGFTRNSRSENTDSSARATGRPIVLSGWKASRRNSDQTASTATPVRSSVAVTERN